MRTSETPISAGLALQLNAKLSAGFFDLHYLLREFQSVFSVSCITLMVRGEQIF